MELTNREYLGDGVYVGFDGFQIWLAANQEDNNVIALEPDVLERLFDYSRRLRATIEEVVVDK